MADEVTVALLGNLVQAIQLGKQDAPPDHVFLNTVAACAKSLGALIARGAPVAVDYEGVNLCRDGSLCLVQVAPRHGPVLLIDTFTLGQHAFGAGRLRELLESEDIVKICFDCRADSDALYHLHDTTPTKLWDVQVGRGSFTRSRVCYHLAVCVSLTSTV
jgi:exonuclease 3'-5' domain-containing protein 1